MVAADIKSGVAKIIWNHSFGIMNIQTKCHGNAVNSC